jgi:hypothetical protein
MNTFRRQGFLTYSRKGIMLHRDLLREWVRSSGDNHEQAAA